MVITDSAGISTLSRGLGTDGPRLGECPQPPRMLRTLWAIRRFRCCRQRISHCDLSLWSVQSVSLSVTVCSEVNWCVLCRMRYVVCRLREGVVPERRWSGGWGQPEALTRGGRARARGTGIHGSIKPSMGTYDDSAART